MINNAIKKNPSPSVLQVFLYLDSESFKDRDAEMAALTGTLMKRDIALQVYDSHQAVVSHYEDEPIVYVSVGTDPKNFKVLYDLPLSFRKRWLHFGSIQEITPEKLTYCWLAATEPLQTLQELPSIQLSDQPLVSVFTAAYRSEKKILRPYHSLLNQTYTNWEWVIVDDSDDAGEHYHSMLSMLDDCRIRLIKPLKHSGRIGKVKREAAGHCRGEVLIELDHDDVLTPDALTRIVDAFKRHPECGFAFAEAAEIYEENLSSHYYGLDAGFGYLVYWRQFNRILNRFVNVPRTPSTNWKTIRHLVGLPNHPRIWKKMAYDWVGGHRPSLMVADDYDLMLRTFLCTRALRIPHLLYLQYRNKGADNQTFQRNKQIQFLCAQFEFYYRAKLDDRLRFLQMPDISAEPYRRIWQCAEDMPQWKSVDISDLDEPEKQSQLFIFPHYDEFHAHNLDTTEFVRVVLENQRLGWAGKEIIAVGNVPQGLMAAACRIIPEGRLKWWSTDRNFNSAETIRYGKLLCTGKKIHCVTLESNFQQNVSDELPHYLPLQYLDAYKNVLRAESKADRLKMLMYLKQHFGFKKYLEIGTDQDEIFSQINGCELKIGVDPVSGGTHRMTSDDFFSENLSKIKSDRFRFDLVFIDGLHTWQQVLNDFDHALQCLEQGGVIVLHDCMPFNERQQIVPRPQPYSFWTGDVWKALFVIRQRLDIDLAVGDFDWGVGVAIPRANSQRFTRIRGEPQEWTWQDYLMYRDEALRPMSYEALIDWINQS